MPLVPASIAALSCPPPPPARLVSLQETLLWLNSPAALTDNPNVLPPGLENYDPLPFLQSSLDVAAAALLPQLVHELGHSVVAAIKKIKIAPS